MPIPSGSPRGALSLFSLYGKTAIISGVAKSGIGYAIAQILAEAGANVAILYNNNTEAIDGAKEIEKTYGVKCMEPVSVFSYPADCSAGEAYQVDITKAEAVESSIQQIVHEFNGRLDIFVANSGMVWDEGAAIDSSISHYRQVMSTNLDGVYYCAHAAGQHWRRQAQDKTTVTGAPLTDFKGGSFVATASMSGHIVNVPHIQAAYNTSKAGVIHLCEPTTNYTSLRLVG